MLEFFECVIDAVAKQAPEVNDLNTVAQGSRKAFSLAGEIHEQLEAKARSGQQTAQLRSQLSSAAAQPPDAFARQAEQLVEQRLAQRSAEYRKKVTDYLTLIPPRLRTTFSRPEDPHGHTVPATWLGQQAEDLLVLLPPRAPLFREGDSPPEARRWTLIERLGIGGFGEVWKAQNTTLKNTFAAFKFCLDPLSQERILRHEMEIIEQVKNELVDHPHIVRLEDAYLEGPAPWLQYEYIPGGDLNQLVATWPKELPIRARLAVEVLKTLARTVAHCHQLNPAVIHRDLKPGNVLVAKDGRLKITDFGISDTLARQALDETRMASISTTTCATPSLIRWAHTPLYASPQQKDGHPSHPADDVHALGVLLYQLLFGNLNLALGVDFYQDLEDQHVCGPLRDLLSHSIAARVERRYANAGELLAALESLPGDLIARPVPVSPEESEANLDRLIEARYADADTKNAEAQRLLDRREWAAAVSVLETIRSPRMRDPDLYERAIGHRDGKRWINAQGIEFALVPKGTFWMGGENGKCGTQKTTIEHDFYVGVYPVTQGQWVQIMGSNPAYFSKGGSGAEKLTGLSDEDILRFPIENVSWNDCQEFIRKLNEKNRESGWMYRLPRDAEWEYICRGGATSQADCAWNYYFKSPTNTLSAQQANFSESSLGRPCPVGLYQPNLLGIYDLHGNVWEWCEDTYPGNGSRRVSRGGGWNDSAEYCRAACRSGSDPSDRYDLGFRLARVPVR